MSLKTIRAALTKEDFVRKVLNATQMFREAERAYHGKMRELNANYSRHHCPRKPGDVIDLPEGVKPGYTKFTIEEPLPVITQQSMAEFTISFDYIGTFTGPDVEPFKGRLKTTPHDTPQIPNA